MCTIDRGYFDRGAYGGNNYLLNAQFGGRVWGTRLGRDAPQKRQGAAASPKRSIRRVLEDGLGDATGDALRAIVLHTGVAAEACGSAQRGSPFRGLLLYAWALQFKWSCQVYPSVISLLIASS